MPRTKLKVNTSWMSNFAQQGSNQRFLDEIEYYDRGLQREIQESADRTARNIYDIEQTRADMRFLEEDPEGYFYEKEQRELERSNKTFANYRKNWYASHGRKMNDFQAQDFQGYMDRADQWEKLANDVKSYWDLEDAIKNIDSELAQWRLNTQNVGRMPKSKAREAYGAIEVLETQKQALQQKMDELKPSVEAFKTYVPGALKAGYYDLVAGNGENSIFSNNSIFGRTSQAHDELGDITRFTSSIFSPKRSRGEQRAMLDRALKAKQEKYAEWKDAFDKNIQDRESYNKVDRWFKRREENAGTDIFDSNTWLYGMPGLIAGSTSGLSKIVPATITGALTAAATYSTGGLAALGIGAVGGLGTFGLNYGAGVSENNAEVAMAYSDRIKDYLRNQKGTNGSLYDDVIKEGRRKLNMDSITIDDDQVFEQWRNGKYDISNAKVNKQLAKLAVGIESLFQDDMAATTWSSGLETMLQILPLGIGLKSLISKAPIGRLAMRNGVVNSLVKGYEVGSAASPIAGAIYAPIHAMLSPTAKKVGKAVSSVIDDISRTASIADELPKEVLARKFKRDARNRYFKDIAGRWALASASEGIEEGKQHISADRYKNGYYTDAKIKSIGETILDDFLAGSKSAGLLLGMPFESLMSEKDREILKEIKGGFILGGLQTNVVNVSTSIAPYMKQRSATSAIVNSALLNKAAKIDRFNKARTYANMSGSAQSYLNMIDAFDRLKDVNQREFDSTGEYGVAPEYIDEELKAFKSTAVMAADGYTIKQTKAQNIDPQSNEYRDFVAAKALTLDELKDASDVAKEAKNNFSATTTQIMQDVLEERFKATQEGEEYKASPVAEYSSEQNFKQLQTVAEYAALLRRKQQLEVGIMNAESGNHSRIKAILNKQLSEVDDRIKNMRSVISSYTHEDESIDIDNLESVEKNLVLNRDAHDKLSEAYRLSIVADQDYELALDQHEKVVGKAYIDGKEVNLEEEVKWDEVYDKVEFKGGKAKEVIKEIQNTIDDDDDLASAIDEDFDDRTDDEGNETITPEEAKQEEKTVPENNPAEEARADREKEFAEKNKPIPQSVPETPAKPVSEPSEPVSTTTPPVVPPETPKGPVGPENTPEEGPKRKPYKDEYNDLVASGVIDAGWANVNGREVLIVNINGIKIPFYKSSSGTDGKTKGNWYPFFGVGAGSTSATGTTADGNWLIKGGIKEMENGYGIPEILKIQRLLNEKFDWEPGTRHHRGSHYVFDGNAIGGSDLNTIILGRPDSGVLNGVNAQLHIQDFLSRFQTQKRERTQEQNDIIAKLNSLAEQSKKNVKKVTPTHYVITVNGEDIEMLRVHSVMPEYWNTNNNNPSPLQVGNVFDNLARIFFGDKDNIVRYKVDKNSLINQLYNLLASHRDDPNDPSVRGIANLKFKDLFPVQDEFEKTVDDLYALAKEYDRMGWELSTEPIVWNVKFPRGWVAGETDMVAVDREGNIHIIDFKTAKTSKGATIDPFSHQRGLLEIAITKPEYNNRLLELNKEDFTVGPRNKGLSKKARSLIRDIRRDKKAKNLTLVWDDTDGRAKVYGIGSKYTAAPASNARVSHLYEYTDPVTGEKKSVTKGSKMYEYSDQLTAYQEMIKRSISNVAGMEVIGFRVDYTTDDNDNLKTISSIRNQVNGLPFRNLVSESSEMIERLNKPTEPVQPQPEVGPTQPLTVQNNEDDNAIKNKELKKQNKTLNKPTEPIQKPMTIEEAQLMQVSGRANINVNNINEHPELVQGLVFDREFVADAIANGTVELYVEDAEYRGKLVPTVYCDITYKGKTYKHLFIYDNQSLIDKVLALQNSKSPEQKIVATNITRTAGEPKRTDNTPVLDTALVDEPLEEISFDSSKRQFGFVKNGRVIGFAGNNPNMQDPIHNLEGITLPNGTFVYLKRIPRSQSEGGDILWPVVIAENNLQRDGDFIIDCLKNIDLLDAPYITKINGQDVSLGVTRRELLNLLIPYQDDWQSATTTFSIIRDSNNPSRFGIIDSKKQMVTYVDLRNLESINKFKEALSKIQVVDNHAVLVSSIGSPTAALVFVKIKKFFATNKSGIKAINISPSIKFDMDDFRGNGLSGMAWYLKRGMFTTNYDGMDSPLVSINDAGLQDKPTKKTQEAAKPSPIDPVLPDPNEGFDIDELGVFNMGAPKIKKMADVDKPILTADQIKKHLRPILGDIVDDPTVVTIIEDLYSDPRLKTAAVVGKATADGITLYNGAFEYVDYHEAFHRIFELFVPQATRNAIYKRVANQLGISLKDSTSENNFAGHRAIAEYLADKYMDHRRYNVSTNYNWLNRVINWISDVVRMLFHIGERDIYKVFLDINSGKYRNKTIASEENVNRFNKLFGNLNYEIRGQKFEHIANDPMYEELKNSMFYCLLRGQRVDLSGSTVQNTVVSREAIKRGADTLKRFGFDVFGTEVEPDKKSAVQLAMTEMLVKFDAVADDLASMMATISTDYRKVMQDDGREDADGGESQSSYDENFLKWSYEFDKFDKTTSRVKFFFATVPDSEYVDDTKIKQKLATNSLGMPQFIPMNYVFNEVLSNLWDVDTIEEAIGRLTALAMDDPMYAHILRNLKQVMNSRLNPDGTVNADAEALLTQLMNTIRSNRHTFMLLRSVSKAEGKYDIVIQRSDADYNARVFPQQWSQVLAKGGSETLKIDQYGSLIFNPKAKDSAKTFSIIAKFFNDLKDAVSSVSNGIKEITIPQYSMGDYEYEDTMGNRTVEPVYLPTETVPNITEPVNFRKVVAGIIEAFNRIGINIHAEEFNYMLRHKYGAADWEGLKQMLQSNDETESMSSFLFFLNNIVTGNKLNLSDEGMFRMSDDKEVSIDNVYSSMAFVKELGNWKYEFRHAHDQLSVLATGGNRFYEMSDNDYMSDVLRNLNKRGKWFNDLKNDPYNYCVIEDNFGETQTYGSITLDLLTKDPTMKLQLKHFIGFKTDKKNDEGRDYFEISRREDWLSKVGILENDGMISLTLSDKKKYCYITGVKLPGIDYSAMLKAKNPIIDLEAVSQDVFVPDGVASAVYTIQQKEDVVDQFLSYAQSEYQAILRNAARLNDGHRQVANFDAEGQGLRFSSLLGVYEPTFGKDGKPIGEQFISFNNGNHDWSDDLHMAEIHFFDKTEEEQRALIARILSKQAEKELDNAAEMGLIQKVGTHNNPMYNYINKGLNDKVIQSLTNSYMEKMKNDPTFTADMAHSMAIVVYINDISNKAIMSGQEMERLFSGNPAFYKWKYDDYGHLIDRTVDELKRLGGLGSTGVNNFTQLLNIPSKYLDKNGNFTGRYVAAEVDNEEVTSPQYKEMAERMYEGQLRSDIIDTVTADLVRVANTEYESQLQTLRKEKRDLTVDEYNEAVAEVEKWFADRLLAIEKEAADRVDNYTVEELEKDFPSAVEGAKTRANEVSIALSKGIDVADGGAYISDTMCEMLLRMEGAYSKEIQEAFKILRGEIKADYLNQIDAYLKVLTSVIGNQKYTAFGRRLQDGKSVPYYHKMALFPIFECIATGRMKNVFDKMKEQGIDMLLVNSAVKVGSEGSKPINWDDYREDDDKFNERNYVNNHVGLKIKPIFKEAFNFNTYECEFDYLRKQLNTDPKEEEMLRMGTQMQKVVYSNLVPGRTYTKQDNSSITGRELLNEIMDSSNKLSDIGVDKMNKKFFKTNEKGELINRFGNVIDDPNSNDREIDIVKFSKEVSKLMSDRGADKNIMKALEVVTSSAGDQLSIPLGAISNANWLESVLISTINKDVVDVNTPGAFFIQRSVWAMEGNKMYDGKKNVKGDQDDAARKLYNGKRLQMVNEEGSMDCVLSLDFFKDVLPQVWSGEYETDDDGNYVYQRGPNNSFVIDEHGNPQPKKKMRDMTFTEARKWLLKHGIIGGKANIVAYRIPTQAESSIHALRCVDVLPVVRDTVILPQEFTKITGSDFDIDKLGLSTVKWKKNGSDQFKEGTEQYYQNKLIRDYITLLIDPRTQHILHRSIDNDTKLLKDVLKEIESNSAQQETPYGFYTLSTQTTRKDDYITGKIGIGPFALNNNSHILTMLYGVRFKDIPNTLMSDLGLTDLSIHKDKDGNSIMSWLSALINAHVDIAKDPYISRLNVNSFTYNLINTLIRTGFGKDTFYFTTQPIMKELAQAYNNAASSYMADQYKSQYQLQQEAVQKVAEDRFANVEINGWKFLDIVKGITDPKNVGYRPVINAYIKSIIDDGVLKNNANKAYGEVTGATVPKVTEPGFETLSPEQVQALMYLAYLLFDPYALSVSNLVKYSKIDTKKHGKSYIEQQAFLKGFKKLFYNEDGGGLFEEQGLRRLCKQSYIELKTLNAISMTKNILKGQFLQSTNAFDAAVQNMLGMIGKKDSLSVDLWKTISQAIMASIKSEFINQYAQDLPQYHNTYIHDLVSESEETLTYTQKKGSNRVKITGTPKYNLKSYVNKPAVATFDYKEKTYTPSYIVTGYDEETNELILNRPVTVDNEGSIHLTGGANTMYDRFNRLAIELRDNSDYRELLDASGEPANMLLKSLVPGNDFTYTAPMFEYTRFHEESDTYKTLKFIKLFNALDLNGPESNFIIDAWDQLLHDNDHPLLKKFAEDLVVYAFVTSGDQGGFTKFFKQVPYSWRKESGYGDFITRKLTEFQDPKAIGAELLEDTILNNWFDGQLVPKYSEDDFITYTGENKASMYAPQLPYPSVMAALKLENGIYTPSIDPEKAPIYIKIPRRKDYQAKDSQRRVTVYRRMTFGMRRQTVPNGTAQDGTTIMKEKWVHFPIYVKVEPKGNKIRGNYLMTEYGREDALNKEYTPSEQGIRDMFAIGDIIADSEVQAYSDRFGQVFAQMIQDMNYNDVLENVYDNNMNKFSDALNKQNKNSDYKGVTKIISGGQTGVDTIGLEVGKELGLQTGGTITPGFYREQNVDQYTRQQLEEFGLQEISKELQAGKSGKEFYLPRTELNVVNSDGTVYFASDEDSAGKIATERFAKAYNKPFILNPTAELLKAWLAENNISVLNVAGNRGSKIGNMRDSVVSTLKEGLAKEESNTTTDFTSREDRIKWNRENVSDKIHYLIFERSTAEKQKNVLYIFTDNTDRTSGSGQIDPNSWYALKYGQGLKFPTKTTAVVRGLDNARPVSTQRWYHDGAKGESGRWNDSDFEEFKKVIDAEFADIFEAWDTGQYDWIAVPMSSNNGGYRLGLYYGKISQITPERTPKLFEYLQDKMAELNEHLVGKPQVEPTLEGLSKEQIDELKKEAEDIKKQCKGK